MTKAKNIEDQTSASPLMIAIIFLMLFVGLRVLTNLHRSDNVNPSYSLNYFDSLGRYLGPIYSYRDATRVAQTQRAKLD